MRHDLALVARRQQRLARYQRAMRQLGEALAVKTGGEGGNGGEQRKGRDGIAFLYIYCDIGVY